MESYDYIFVGGGAAGLSLAYHLAKSSLRDQRMLMIEPTVKAANDHTWCFWTEQPSPFSAICYRSWAKVGFRTNKSQTEYDLGPLRYHMIRASDFYEYTQRELAALPNMKFHCTAVDQIVDGTDCVIVSTKDAAYKANWVFDSRIQTGIPNPNRYRYLHQHFLGWEIETDQNCFDPSLPVLFDFRTPQAGEMRFIYLLPLEPRRALIEFTLFSANLLAPSAYEQALKSYLTDILHLEQYTICAVEKGVIPMTDQPFPRKGGNRILNIGTRGGRVKPSTGYAFLRIQQDSSAIVRSLENFAHPFALPQSSARYRLFDSVFLQVLLRRGGIAERIFTRLFQNNPIHRLLAFLDESSGVIDNLRLMATVPLAPFLSATAHVLLQRKP